MKLTPALRALTFVVLASCSVLAACGDDNDAVVLSETVEAMVAFTEEGPSGATTELSSLTSFDWETVYYFSALTPREDAEDAVGQSIDVNDNNRWAYLVFTAGDEVVRVEQALPPLTLDGAPGKSYSADEAMISVVTAGVSAELTSGDQ